MTRSSFTCMKGPRSPISSKNTLPSGGQTSSQPLRSSSAPVKAPRRWPNNADSTRVDGSAERLMGKKVSEKSPSFYNPNNQDLEAMYSFPLPKSASLSEVTIYVGGREINGEYY